MNHWLVSSNPASFDLAGALERDGFTDWMTRNSFQPWDIVYIYEVSPPRGAGKILYRTEVAQTRMSPRETVDDAVFWAGGTYPHGYDDLIFSRLNLLKETDNDELGMAALRRHGFVAPQGTAHILDKKPALLAYIETYL